jgi:hypothetical protein
MLSTHTLFEWLVGLHIATGTVGLVVVWIPIAGRKGGELHRRAGTLFVQSMIATGFTAIAISITTLSDPTGTHPHLASHDIFADPQTITNIFGWMMLYLATLTVNLAWQGWLSMRNGLDHVRNRAWHNLLSQVLLTVVSTNCFVRGVLAAEPMMMGISMVGFATVATNLWFIYKPSPLPTDRIKEHIKCLVGAGISVYTAFFAFGAVRLIPELALQPGLWAIPLIVGLTLIIYHQRAVTHPARRKWRVARGRA